MPAEGKVDGLAVSGEEWIERQSFRIVELHQRRWRAAIDRRLGDVALSVGRDDANGIPFAVIRLPGRATGGMSTVVVHGRGRARSLQGNGRLAE